MNTIFHGKQLRLARLMSQKTFADIGDAIVTSRQYVQQLEKGTRIPSREVIESLAHFLGVTPSFFSSSVNVEVHDEDCHFRSRKSTTKTAIDQALVHCTLLNELVLKLETEYRVKLPEDKIREVDHPPKSRDEIEALAEDCRRSWKLGLNTPIKDMTRVLENFGAVVGSFADLSEKIDGFSWVCRRKFVVLSSAMESATRRRMSLAHELGHLIMHGGIETGDPETEQQANMFASAFLVPRNAFCNEFKVSKRWNWTRMFALKERWKVSLPFLVRRAYDLRLIDPIMYRSGNIHIRKNFGRKEPYEPNHEKPEILKKIFEKLEESFEISPEQIALTMGWSGATFQRITGVEAKAQTGQIIPITF